MSKNLPVDLILANLLHETAEGIERIGKLNPAAVPTAIEHAKEELVRTLLCRISHNASMAVVAAALAASNAPSTVEECLARLAAVRDARRSAIVPAAAPKEHAP